MIKAPTLRDLPDPPEEVIEAGLNGQLVLFVGAGMSILLDLPSWVQLANRSLEELRGKGMLDYSEMKQLEDLDARTQMSIAQLIAEENKYPLDLTKHFKGKSEAGSIYKAINDIGCTCVTTNYDELLSPRYLETASGSTTARPVVRIIEKADLFARRLDEPAVVAHIHGAISKPGTMIVTTRDYLTHYDDKNVQHFLGELFDRKTVLFLGYGLEEAEVLEHILRRGSATTTRNRRRFALQGFFRSQEPLYQRLHQYYHESFGVHLIGFIRDFADYRQQEAILSTWSTRIKINKPALADDVARINKVLGDG